jgi:hypothetical protein
MLRSPTARLPKGTEKGKLISEPAFYILRFIPATAADPHDEADYSVCCELQEML